jgi:hypothetical protein
MDTSEYWQIRLNELRKALEKNNFEAYVAENSSEANNLVTRTVIPETGAKTVLRGDSMTCIEAGQLVNLDMVGNRVGGITFGPKHVIVLVGRNKIVPDLGSAMERTRNYAAPANAMRFGLQTPCAKTARCSDCSSPDRICNTWSILEKSYPKGRVKVVLINEDLGL